jgi:hypothetical protein
MEATLRSSYERSGIGFGGFRPTEHIRRVRRAEAQGQIIILDNGGSFR